MGFIALIFALLIEQGRPLPAGNVVHASIARFADAVMRETNAGERRHGAFGWFAVVAVMLGLVGLAQWVADLLHPVALFCVHVTVLYLTIGFRQFSHPFTEIQLALAAGDVDGARRTLSEWLRARGGEIADDAPVSEICRVSIANALVASHRHVFGPLLWYVLIPGAYGPVLYRVAVMLARRWPRTGERYGDFAARAFGVLDWLPLRLTASGFAIVGNFEDAIFAWRGAAAAGTGRDSRALLLATGGGALGLRLADPELEARWGQGEPGGYEWQGVEAGTDGMRSAVGLVWRSVVLWVGLFAMLTVASWLGR
jgi:adenosylcobinamide-phosphate synthase